MSKTITSKEEDDEEAGHRQFSLRNLFLGTTAIAAILGLVQVRFFWQFGNSLFWLALLAPLWFPDFAVPGRRRTPLLRRMLCLVGITWYLTLVYLYLTRQLWDIQHILGSVILCEAIVVAGTLTALAALAYGAKGWRHLVNVPLWIAILAGSAKVFHWWLT